MAHQRRSCPPIRSPQACRRRIRRPGWPRAFGRRGHEQTTTSRGRAYPDARPQKWPRRLCCRPALRISVVLGRSYSSLHSLVNRRGDVRRRRPERSRDGEGSGRFPNVAGNTKTGRVLVNHCVSQIFSSPGVAQVSALERYSPGDHDRRDPESQDGAALPNRHVFCAARLE